MASGTSSFDPQLAISHKFPETTYTFSERDAALYALGIGAAARDPLDADELKFVYHEKGQQFIQVLLTGKSLFCIYNDWKLLRWPFVSCWNFQSKLPVSQVLPTFAALFSLSSIPIESLIPGLEYDPRLLLHGQQYIELYKPLPSSGRLHNKFALAGLHDKGKAAILEIETKTYGETGELLCMNRMTAFLRGAGGFSNSSRPFSYSNYPAKQVLAPKIPKCQPFAVFEDRTQPSQALLYRLSGDYNPLHSDPAVAKVAGFTQPILHGLCSLGFAVRAIIKCVCNGDPNMIKSISGRFLLHVYPGETLITEMWLEGKRVIYQAKVKERNRTVLAGFVDLNGLTSSL